jgi:excisionase family DNA binding protein
MKTETNPISGLDPLLSIEDLAEYLGVPVATIYDWRVDGKGPCGIRVGRHVKFTVTDVLEWLAAKRESRPGESRATSPATSTAYSKVARSRRD